MDVNISTETVSSDKDFVLLSKQSNDDELKIEIHPLPEGKGVNISVQPPKEAQRPIKYIAYDIVLAIDLSGFMSAEAPVPTSNTSERERNGLTVLDLAKHAGRTILEILDENDPLGLVTFLWPHQRCPS
jgi:hypothetical protein